MSSKEREKVKSSEKDKPSLPDENDDAAASVRVIRRENARPGVGAMTTQSR